MWGRPRRPEGQTHPETEDLGRGEAAAKVAMLMRAGGVTKGPLHRARPGSCGSRVLLGKPRRRGASTAEQEGPPHLQREREDRGASAHFPGLVLGLDGMGEEDAPKSLKL